jgi:molybdopterin synthase sulfur carrier subunit
MAEHINIRFFGMIAERLGKDSDVWSDTIETNTNCRELISSRYPEISKMDYQIAINQELCEVVPDESINEIAVLPPFAGG